MRISADGEDVILIAIDDISLLEDLIALSKKTKETLLEMLHLQCAWAAAAQIVETVCSTINHTSLGIARLLHEIQDQSCMHTYVRIVYHKHSSVGRGIPGISLCLSLHGSRYTPCHKGSRASLHAPAASLNLGAYVGLYVCCSFILRFNMLGVICLQPLL